MFTKYNAKSVLFDISKTFADDNVVTIHLAFFYEKVNEGDATPTLQLWRVDENGTKIDDDNAHQFSDGDGYTNTIDNSYCTTNDFDTWINKAFADLFENITVEEEAYTFSSGDEGWQFKTKVIVKEESAEQNWFFDGEWSTPFTYSQG